MQSSRSILVSDQCLEMEELSHLAPLVDNEGKNKFFKPSWKDPGSRVGAKGSRFASIHSVLEMFVQDVEGILRNSMPQSVKAVKPATLMKVFDNYTNETITRKEIDRVRSILSVYISQNVEYKKQLKRCHTGITRLLQIINVELQKDNITLSAGTGTGTEWVIKTRWEGYHHENNKIVIWQWNVNFQIRVNTKDHSDRFSISSAVSLSDASKQFDQGLRSSSLKYSEIETESGHRPSEAIPSTSAMTEAALTKDRALSVASNQSGSRAGHPSEVFTEGSRGGDPYYPKPNPYMVYPRDAERCEAEELAASGSSSECSEFMAVHTEPYMKDLQSDMSIRHELGDLSTRP
jgi:hypothetical protein